MPTGSYSFEQAFKQVQLNIGQVGDAELCLASDIDGSAPEISGPFQDGVALLDGAAVDNQDAWAAVLACHS